MKSFQETCASWGPLQTFDPAAFEGDENVPQSLCNLVLAKIGLAIDRISLEMSED